MPLVSPPRSSPSSRRRPAGAWVAGPRQSTSLQVGIGGTILLHLLLLWIAPKIEKHMFADVVVLPSSGDTPLVQNFDIQLADIPPPPPDQYVETNPDAPDNPPDETDQFSDRNQQLAQEIAAEEEGDMPSTEGSDEIDTTSIVSGDNIDDQPPIPALPPSPEAATIVEPATEEQAFPALAQDPLSGTEEISGENEDGIGTNVVELPENPVADIEEPIEGVQDPEQATAEGRNIYYRPDPNRPAPRPNLSRSQTRPAILSERVTGSKNVGIIAHNALRTTFGDYLARMHEVVQLGWYHDIRGKIDRRLGFPLSGSYVRVSFTLHKDGSVTIDDVEGNAGPLWQGVAVEAVASPARAADGFGEWEPDMVTILGEETPITFTFYYQ